MKTTEQKLQSISAKYSRIHHDDDNYNIGGGLDSCKFASRRHEAAKEDEGKLTLGKAAAMFKKATDLNIDTINEVINYAVPNMEWHHAGHLPKSYGGGMKKTYFLNSFEICDIANNFDNYLEKLSISKNEKRIVEENKKILESKKLEFLRKNATFVHRILMSEKYQFNFYELNREMNGKHGWFVSYGKSYNLPDYYTGWSFESEEKYREFLNIK